ncbi:hypothetical protein MTO96_019911 [Rhipicephalus appendiculatus]
MAAEHPQRTKLRYQSNSTFVLKPKSGGGGRPLSPRPVQRGPSVTRMVECEEVSETVVTAMPVSSTINTPSARTSYMALEVSETPATMMGASSMGPMGYPTSGGSPVTTLGSMHPGLMSDMRVEETFEADFGSDAHAQRGALEGLSQAVALPPSGGLLEPHAAARQGLRRRRRVRSARRRSPSAPPAPGPQGPPQL